MRKGEIQATRVWKRFRADKRRMLLRDQLERMQHRFSRSTDNEGWRWALRDVDVVPGRASRSRWSVRNGSGKKPCSSCWPR